MTKNIFVVGRHSGTFPAEFSVVATESVNFSIDLQECKSQLKDLMEKAGEKKSAIVFQTLPGVAVIALTHLVVSVGRANDESLVGWKKIFAGEDGGVGMVVSKPGKRLAGVSKEFSFNAVEDGEVAKEAILMANPNAKVLETEPVFFGVGYTPEKLTVTVDPPMRFEFSHIEWL